MVCALKYPIMHADFPNLWVCVSLSVCVCWCVRVCVPVCLSVCECQSQQFSDYYKPETSPTPSCLFRSLTQIFLMISASLSLSPSRCLRPQDTAAIPAVKKGGCTSFTRSKCQLKFLTSSF